MNYADLFHVLQPGFFDKEYIRTLPEDEVFDEQIIDLHAWQEGAPVPCPEHITFGFYKGDAETLAGLLLEIKRNFPKLGDSFESHGIRFTVEAVEGRRVDKIKVILNAE